METLTCSKRIKNCSHSANKERRNGKIPGVLYGKNVGNILFEIGDIELSQSISRNGEHGEMDIDLNGKAYRTLIKEVQRDPVKHNIIHMDLEELDDDKTILTDVPLNFEGEGYVRSRGGIIQKEKDSVQVRCKGNNIPRSINVDISNFNLGDTFKVCNIEVGNEISIMDDMNSVIVSVTKNTITDIVDESENGDVKIGSHSNTSAESATDNSRVFKE